MTTNTWIRPLQARVDESRLTILAPNRYVREKVQERYLKRIVELIEWHGDPASPLSVELEVGGGNRHAGSPFAGGGRWARGKRSTRRSPSTPSVKGISNEMAVATADYVAKNPGGSYNPLLLYGGVGLGKTHLMHAVGNEVLRRSPRIRVTYLHSQVFVQEMVRALQTGTMQTFTQYLPESRSPAYRRHPVLCAQGAIPR